MFEKCRFLPRNGYCVLETLCFCTFDKPEHRLLEEKYHPVEQERKAA